MLYLTIDLRAREPSWQSTNKLYMHEGNVRDAKQQTRAYVTEFESVDVPALDSPRFQLAILTTNKRPSAYELLMLSRTLAIIFRPHYAQEARN